MSVVPALRPPPPLLNPSTSSTKLKLAAASPFSPSNTSSDNSPYVLHVVPTPLNNVYLFAGSDDSLRLFDGELKPVGELKGKQKQTGITSLVAGGAVGDADVGAVAWTTARDGTVIGWDLRTGQEAVRLKGKSGAPYLVCSQSSDMNCLAVGTELHHHEAHIELWDLRTLKLSHTYSESHSDDLTLLTFHPSPSLSHVLLSGSVDGLLNSYDIRITDEDDAVLNTSQIGSSVVNGGWMRIGNEGKDWKGAWTATSIETLQLWNAEESTLLHDLNDIRDVCLEPWRSDYLISGRYNDTLSGLCVLTGTQRGDFALISLADPSRWIMEQLLPGAGGRTLAGTNTSYGHSDIVRCAYFDEKTGKVVSGGEDGKVCLWSI